MSVLWLGRAWETPVGSPTRKAVLIALADRCGEEGICWPSYADIMFRTELGRTAVRQSLEDLEVDGFIETWERARPNGSETSKGYRLLIPAISGVPRGGTGGAARRQGAMPRGGTPEPSDEPSRGTSTSRSRAARPAGKVRRVRGEDHGDDEAPALGASPRPESPADEERAPRKLTGYRLALRLQKRLAGQPGSAATVDVRALASQLSAKVRAGSHTIEQLEQCVELYASAPDRYRSGDMKGWTQFLAALPKLEKDAETVQQSEQGGSRYGGAYDGVTE